VIKAPAVHDFAMTCKVMGCHRKCYFFFENVNLRISKDFKHRFHAINKFGHDENGQEENIRSGNDGNLLKGHYF
jgi:hypothetical protein